MELLSIGAYYAHEFGAKKNSDSARSTRYLFRGLKEAGNYAADLGLPGRVVGFLVPGLVGETMHWGARAYNYIGRGPQLPVIDRNRWGIPRWAAKAPPTWHRPEYPQRLPDPNNILFDPNERTQDLHKRNPVWQREWNTWVSQQIFESSSHISAHVRNDTNNGNRIASYSTNAAFGSFMSKTIRAIPHRDFVEVAAHAVENIPTAEEWRTILAVRGMQNADAKERAAARGIDAQRWYALQDAMNNNTDAVLANIYQVRNNAPNQVADDNSVIALEGHRTQLGNDAVDRHENRRRAINPTREPLNREMWEAIDYAIQDHAKALEKAEKLEKLQRSNIDHIFTVTSMNWTNIEQRKFEAEEIDHMKRMLRKFLWKDLKECAIYGYMLQNASGGKSMWLEVLDKEKARFFGLLIEVDPIHSRKQGTPVVP